MSYATQYDIHFGPAVFHYERAAYGPIVRKGDDKWLDIVTWISFGLMQAEEWDIRSDNLEQIVQESEDPRLLRFLNETGGLDARLGLEPTVFQTVVSQVGNYAELYDRHLGEATRSSLPRGLNELYLNGGLLYSPPFTSR